MRTTSATYQTLRAQTGAFYEVQVLRGNRVYTMEDLFSINVNPKLFEGNGPSIGNAYSSYCKMELIESSANWPRMAEFTVRIRLSSADGLTTSEWLSMGTYYTDTRKELQNGRLTIEAYDGMLMMERYWTDEIDSEDLPASWPITSQAFITMIENAGLAEIDERSEIDDTVTLIGLNTKSTIRDVLKTIAAAHGGNWVMTYEGKLRLVQFDNYKFRDPAIAGIAIAGLSIVGTSDYSGPTIYVDYTDINMDVQSITNTPPLSPVTSVHLETDAGNATEAGTNEGAMISGICNYASSSGVALLCLEMIERYVYKPFSAQKAVLDPAADIGDIVFIDGESYQMMDMEWNIHNWPIVNISAAYEEELNHEYIILDESAKTLRKAVAIATEESASYIEQTAEEIQLGVSNNYYSKIESDVIQQTNESNFMLTSEQIQAALSQISTLNGEVNEINYYIRYEVIEGVGTVIVGQTNSLAELRITNNQISLMYNGSIISYWNQSKQYTPKQLEIPLGGGFKLGNVLWQPRSSGNLSIFLVNS